MNIFDQACFGIIPDIKGHKSDEKDNKGNTVAMILAYHKIIPPKQWQHESSL